MLVSSCRACFDHFEEDALAVGNEATDEVETMEERVEDAVANQDVRVRRTEGVMVASVQRGAREDERHRGGAAVVEEAAPRVAEVSYSWRSQAPGPGEWSAQADERARNGARQIRFLERVRRSARRETETQREGVGMLTGNLQGIDEAVQTSEGVLEEERAGVGVVGEEDLTSNVWQRTEEDAGYLKVSLPRVKWKAVEEARRVDVDDPTVSEEAQMKAEEVEKKMEEEMQESVVAEARMIADAETPKIVEAEVVKKAAAEAQRIAAAETKKKATAEALKIADAEAHKKAEAEAQKKAKAEAQKKAEAGVQKKAEAEAAAADAHKMAEGEAQKYLEAEAQKRAEAEELKIAEAEVQQTPRAEAQKMTKKKVEAEMQKFAVQKRAEAELEKKAEAEAQKCSDAESEKIVDAEAPRIAEAEA
ncbi:unnamed protein product [Closterium sp. Naga37s-1]|nr:unnamed protein product [Closterium sp. Naga37s-1]